MLSPARARRGSCLLLLALVLTALSTALARPALAPAAPALMTQSPGALASPDEMTRERVFAGAKYIGAGTLRHIVEYRSGFSWAATDALITETANHGLFSYLTLTYKPLQNGPAGTDLTPTVAGMASFCGQAATRYGATVTDYSVMNEPNSYTWQWADGVHPVRAADYGDLYRACYSAIKAADPSSRVYFGELANGSSSISPCNYLANAMSTSVTRADGVAIHPYQFDTAPTTALSGATCRGIGRIANWSSALAGVSGSFKTPAGGTVPVAVTEFGYCRPQSSAACPAGAPSTEAGRASWLSSAYDAASAAGATLFNYYHLAPGDPSWDTGIMNADGSATDSMATLRAKTGSTWESGYVRTPDNAIYRIVGGAAIRVYDCANLPGCTLPRNVASLSGYASTPANGTFVRIVDGPAGGQVNEVVGGAMIPVGDCAAVNNCAGWINLDHQGFEAYVAAHPDIADGTLVRQANGAAATQITRSVGGALLPIGTCSYYNNCAGWVSVDEGGLTTYNAKHKDIADGTFVRQLDGAAAGQVTRVAGGMRMAIAGCSTVGGCGAWVDIDAYALTAYDATHKAIKDGAFVRQHDGAAAGQVSRSIGGALLPVQNCAALGGCDWVDVDEQALTYYRSTHGDIRDGTFVRQVDGAAAGQITRVAGGVRMAIAGCSTVGGCTDTVEIDESGLTAYDAHHKDLRDGVNLRQHDGAAAGQVSRAVGGAVLPLASCTGCAWVDVDEQALTYYRSTHGDIRDGTFVRQSDGAAAGEISRAAGGALVKLTDCTPLAGCTPRVDVDEYALTVYRASHAQPKDGTVLKGAPSDTYWLITDGHRSPTTASGSAVAVNDASLGAFPTA